jgi:hypothetical protein
MQPCYDYNVVNIKQCNNLWMRSFMWCVSWEISCETNIKKCLENIYLWNSTNAPCEVGIFKVVSRARSLCTCCFIIPQTYISCTLCLLTKHVQWIVVWKCCREEGSTMWWHGLRVNLKKNQKMLMQTMSNSEHILQLIRLD